MLIEPRTRGFICLTAHPGGCASNVSRQIAYMSAGRPISGARKVLVIGASTGFGLSSRIAAAFTLRASTIGVFFEKPPVPGKTASPGWYNTAAFEKEAAREGLYAGNINGDAFSDEIKQQTIALIKKDWGETDLVIYSLASPARKHPVTGELYKSVIKPIGETYKNKTVDFHTGQVSEIAIPPATGKEVDDTVEVMGGDDWQRWIDALSAAGVLANGAVTIAYSYIGPSLTVPIYRNGSIGAAKDDLEKAASQITSKLAASGGKAYVSVNKALVTQASAAIPVIPLYISILFRIMKEKGIHEGCMEQILRLFRERLFTSDGEVEVDAQGRIRIDDLEMRADVQKEVAARWKLASTQTLPEIADLNGYRDDFFSLFGFGIAGIDYALDTEEMIAIRSLV